MRQGLPISTLLSEQYGERNNRMRTRSIALLLLACGPLTPSVLAQGHTERGAVLGGVTGALAGAAIGDKNDETAAGALIGGAVGLLTGATIGNSVDQHHAYAQAAQQQRITQWSRAVSTSDVVSMADTGISDSVIINHIHENGVRRRLEVPDVISLHQQGVSEAVIASMQRARLAGHASPRPLSYQPPVVVQEYRYVPRPRYYPPRHLYHRYPNRHAYRHRPSGVHWSVTVGR